MSRDTFVRRIADRARRLASVAVIAASWLSLHGAVNPIFALDKVYFAEFGNGRIYRSNLDGTSLETIIASASGAWGFDLDAINGKIYWADRSAGVIRRANLDGTGVQNLVTGLSTPVDVRLDVPSGKMYWVNELPDTIQRANLDGSNVETLLTGPTSCTHGLALDAGAGKMYWTDCGGGAIRRANLDGTNVQVVIANTGGGAIGIDVDPSAGKMYIGNQGLNYIQRANLDGTGLVNLISVPCPMGVRIDRSHGKVFFTNRCGTEGLRRANLDGTGVENLIVSGLSSPAMLAFTLAACGNGITEVGEQCDDGNVANGDCCSSTCQYEPNGAACASDGLPCSTDVCNATGTCTHNASPSGTPCRVSAGVCDVAETCDGAATSCPADGFAASGECRPAADVCDAPENCDNSGPNCPADAYLSTGECRASAGVCDPAESCDGSGIACPFDAKSTDPCRASADVCDVAESCDGINDDCPVDGFAMVGTLCRADAGQCDVADVCTGLSAACPADAKEPNDTPCNDTNACTQTDTCQAGTCVGADPLDCDDNDACTADSCEPLGGCLNDDAPATGCLTPGKSIVLLKSNASDHTKDKLLWKWIKGAELSQMDLADPITSDSYALCVYAGTASTLIADAALPPGSSWSAIGTKGYKFKGSSPDGLSLALLKGGATGKSKALAKGKGTALPDPTLPVAYPVTVQLKKEGSPLCLVSTFTSTDEVKNTATQFKAKK